MFSTFRFYVHVIVYDMEVDGATTLWAEWPVLPQITWILMGEVIASLPVSVSFSI